MKKSIFIILLLFSCFQLALGQKTETLNYVISYKWGLIHKDAGEAQLKMTENGNQYTFRLVGKTKPWADKFYKVRDTLISKVGVNGFKPISYSKIAHEKGKYGRDDISFKHAGSSVTGHAKRLREKDGKITSSEKNLSATGPTFDMLSVFYYLRRLDFNKLKGGDVVKVNIFSGSKVEEMTVRCKGIENIKLDNGKKEDAYHIVFKFTTEGKKKSSDDIDCWISADSQHIPLLVVGSLPVGQVRCRYVGK